MLRERKKPKDTYRFVFSRGSNAAREQFREGGNSVREQFSQFKLRGGRLARKHRWGELGAAKPSAERATATARTVFLMFHSSSCLALCDKPCAPQLSTQTGVRADR